MHVPELSGIAVLANIQVPVHNQGAANAGPDSKQDDVTLAPRDSGDPLGNEGAVGIVLKKCWNPRCRTHDLGQRHVAHPRHVGRKEEHASLLVDHTCTPDADALDLAPLRSRVRLKVPHPLENQFGKLSARPGCIGQDLPVEDATSPQGKRNLGTPDIDPCNCVRGHPQYLPRSPAWQFLQNVTIASFYRPEADCQAPVFGAVERRPAREGRKSYGVSRKSSSTTVIAPSSELFTDSEETVTETSSATR